MKGSAKAKTAQVRNVVEGHLPSTGRFHRITIYVDNSIRIERDGFAPLVESDWFPHRFLISLLEDIGKTYPLAVVPK